MSAKIDYIKLLNLFVANEDRGAFILTKPFYCDELATATNGHIACVVPREIADISPNLPHKQYPKVKLVFPVQLPEAVEVETVKLFSDECAAAMKLRGDCKECEGSGECECLCGDEHECGECAGTGTSGPPRPIAQLAAKKFQYQYLDIIRRAAEITNSRTINYYDCGKDAVSVFEFDQVRCVVMPLRSDAFNQDYPELLEKDEMTETKAETGSP